MEPENTWFSKFGISVSSKDFETVFHHKSNFRSVKVGFWSREVGPSATTWPSLPQMWTICQLPQFANCPNLVGGFNPFEKYESNWDFLPQVGMKIKNI